MTKHNDLYVQGKREGPEIQSLSRKTADLLVGPKAKGGAVEQKKSECREKLLSCESPELINMTFLFL